MKKRIISAWLILALCIASVSLPPVAFSAEKKLEKGIEFTLDFNDCKTTEHIGNLLNGTSGRWIFPQTVDREHSVSMAMKSPSNISAIKSFSQPIGDDIFLLSFEVRQTSTTANAAQVRFYRGGKAYRSFIANQTGYMGLSRFTNGSTLDYKISYKANQWYSVNMWIDFFDRTIYYYIDNEFIGKTHLDPEMDKIDSLRFFVSSNDAREYTYWDNISFRRVDEDLINELHAKNILIPEKVDTPLKCTFNVEIPGNNFPKDMEISQKLSFEGRILNDKPYRVLYEVRRSDGTLAWSMEEDIALNEGEKLEKVIYPAVTAYDIYTLNVTVAHDGKKNVFSKEFSKIHTPSPEFSSHKFGSSGGHMMKMTRSHPDNVLPLFEMSGMGIIREGINWGEFERKKGIYGMSDKMKERFEKILAFTEEHDIYMTMNISGSNSLYPNPTAGSAVTRTPEGLDALEKFACALAKTYPEIDAYLFQNEPDAKAIYQMSCEDYANALKRFYIGIKKGNPNAKVWGCNTMRANTPWVEGVIMAGGGDYMDGVTIHPYQGQGSGETAKWVEYVSLTRQMLDSYGYEHLTICASEANTSSNTEYNTEIQHGFNLIRQWSLMDANPRMLDSYITYTFATFDDNIKDNESNFGITRGWNVDNTAGAKPAYMAVSNFLAQIEGKTFEKLLHDDDIYVYHYKDDKGEDMLMMYSDVTSQQISLKIDTAKGELYDWYGNKTNLNAIDGTYTFIVDDCPRYFRGDFTDVEFTEGEISIDSPLTEMTVGSRKSVNINMKNPYGYEYEIEGNESIKASVSKTDSGAVANLRVLQIPEKFDFTAQRNDYSTLDRRDYVFVNVKKNGKLYARLPLGVKYVENPIDVSLLYRPYPGSTKDHYDGVITIKNNHLQRSASGKIIIDSPTLIAESLGELSFKNISPGEQTEIVINIPDSLIETPIKITGKAVLTNGEEVSFISAANPRSYYKEPGAIRIRSLHRKNTDIKIDGVIEDSEWKEYKLTNFDKSEVTFGADLSIVDAGVVTQQTFTEDADYGTGNDFSGTLYAMWDDEFLYMAAKVRDDVHFNKEGPVKLRTGDSAYWSIVPTLSQRHDATFLFGLTDFYGEFEPLLFNTWTNVPDQRYSYLFGGREGEDESEFNIIREGEYTTYEAKVPWEYLLPEFTGLNQNFSMSFSVRDFDGDRDKSYSYSRWFILAE